jgi:RNA polymerase sigma factor (sigma-70 family)
MTETLDTDRDSTEAYRTGMAATISEVRAWFMREVVPLEPALIQYLQHNWRNKSDIADLRQDVYVRVFEAARERIPERARQFVFTTARNLLIDRVRREQIVPIEAVADLDALEIAKDAPGPDRSTMARDELRKLQAALDRLPARCREAVVLQKIDGLSLREISLRMGVAETTVKTHLADGVRALANMIYGQPLEPGGKP